MSRLRILHVSPYSPAAWAYGGIPRVVEGLTEGLAERGHHVTLCTTDACDASSRLGQMAAGAQRTQPGAFVGARPPEWRIFRNVSNRAAFHWQAFAPIGFAGYVRRAAHRFDVAHVHACHNVLGVLASRALRRAGVPYVVMPNGTAPIHERRHAAKRMLARVGGDGVLAGAARILAVSPAEERQLESLGIEAARIARMPNPVTSTTADRGSLRPGVFRQRFGCADRPLVLFLGKVTPRKELPTLVRALRNLTHRRACLVIAGSDLGGRNQALALARELGLADRVRVIGVLRGGERLEALAAADVVAYATRDEIFGLVPCEALAAGTPVVVGNDSGCAQVIEQVGGGLCVPPGDAIALGHALDDVLSDVACWRQRAAAAGREIAERYSPEAVSSRLEAIYADVLEKHRRLA